MIRDMIIKNYIMGSIEKFGSILPILLITAYMFLPDLILSNLLVRV